MAFRLIAREFRRLGQIMGSEPDLLAEKPMRLRERIAERIAERKPLFSGERMERLKALRKGYAKPEFQQESPTSSQPSKVHSGQETMTPREFVQERLPIVKIVREKIERGELMPIRRALAKRIETSALNIEGKPEPKLKAKTQPMQQGETQTEEVSGKELKWHRGLRAGNAPRGF